MNTADDHLARAADAKREGRFAAASDSLLRAIQLLRQENDSAALAHALRNLGEVQRSLPGSDGGIAAYNEAIAIFRQHSAPLKLAHTIRHLGDIYRHAGDFDQATRCYDEALSIYRSDADTLPLDLANALRSSALLKEKTGDEQQAMTLWEEARNLYVAANIETGAAEGSHRLARLNRESKQE
ncbi:MAG: tetratricopeptide repeat protein [Acidobacteriota bacterium]|nr:tetratricopeptide repeat protein [Acidobacteriota bacterium]